MTEKLERERRGGILWKEKEGTEGKREMGRKWEEKLQTR